MSEQAPLSWFGIVRLGCVQMALGAIFVLSTSTLNRVMVVELALPAVLPGLLIALHYATQVLRPRLGHGSDLGGRRTPWIIGGMAVLASGGVLAALATALMKDHRLAGIALAVAAFVAIGLGVGAAGTALLVLIAKRTAPERRPAAATIAWVMMLVGFIATAIIAGKTLDPFTPTRLVAVAAAIASAGFVLSVAAVRGIEGRAVPESAAGERATGFAQALREVWAEPQARRFAIFIFVSMLAYGGEDLMIEPFAGAIFGMTIAQTATLSGALHVGSLAGMILVPLAGWALRRVGGSSLTPWMIGGCVVSCGALATLAALGVGGVRAPLGATLVVLGLGNGVYAIAAIGSMMQYVGSGSAAREGTRMGLWGAAQAVAFGTGGLVATAASDIARHLVGWQPGAYASVFGAQAAIFLVAAVLAARLRSAAAPPARSNEGAQTRGLATASPAT